MRNGLKRRIYDKIAVNGDSLYTLFDTGSRNTYITEMAARKLNLKLQTMSRPYKAKLGGEKRIIKHFVVFQGTLHGLPMLLQAFVLDKLAKSEYKKIDIDLLFGIWEMERWGVELDIEHKKLDLSAYTREFVDF